MTTSAIYILAGHRVLLPTRTRCQSSMEDCSIVFLPALNPIQLRPWVHQQTSWLAPIICSCFDLDSRPVWWSDWAAERLLCKLLQFYHIYLCSDNFMANKHDLYHWRGIQVQWNDVNDISYYKKHFSCKTHYLSFSLSIYTCAVMEFWVVNVVPYILFF